MRLDCHWLTRLAFLLALFCSLEARRVRVQAVEDEDDIQYYSAEPQDGSNRAVVLVSSADDYNGLYGQPAVSRNAQDNYIPQSRGSAGRSSPSFKDTRVSTKEANKTPPVQTIRNYNKVNDDGSFTFGYEAADGSFKEETRGTDCVVRGKYGYIDPDGNKREFTYVSGNPCDPNATKEDESQERPEESNEPENIPANYPRIQTENYPSRVQTENYPSRVQTENYPSRVQTENYPSRVQTENYPSRVQTENYPSRVQTENYPSRLIRPIARPVATPAPLPPKPVAVPVYRNTYLEEDDEIEQPEPEQVLRAQPVQPTRHRLLPSRPAYVPEERPTVLQQRPRIVPSTTPAPVYREQPRPLTITPRPLTVTPTPATTRAQPPATTYRPQLLQIAVTPRPALLYTTKQITVPPRTTHYPSSTPTTLTAARRPSSSALDFLQDYEKFQQDNQIISSTPSPVLRTTKPTPVVHADVQPNSNPVYSSELVFDPSSGQYKTNLFQTLPQTEGDFTLNHQIQPYVHQPAPHLVSFKQLQQQSPLYRAATTPRATQAAYQQQQQEIQLQNSQQLFAHQQRARAQQQHPQAAAALPVRSEPQQFYYIQPQAIQPSVSSGQIDAFLRGHNIQF